MKIYGINKQEMMNFIEFFKKKERVYNLTNLFSEYAKICKKSEGTVRNMYYKIAKKSRDDKEFCDKFLDGKPLLVTTLKTFSKEEERLVLKEILKRKMEGNSVRSAIFKMTGGDGEKALRYQNKYRTADIKLVEQLIKEIKLENPNLIGFLNKEKIVDKVDLIEREINALVNKIASSLRKENAYLKLQIKKLEEENANLKGEESSKNNLLYFKRENTTKNS